MSVSKHPSLIALLDRLRTDLGGDEFVVVDHWEGDTCSTGIAAPNDRHRLVYISTFPPENPGFAYECEVASTDPEFPYEGQGVVDVPTYDDLLQAVRSHLMSG